MYSVVKTQWRGYVELLSSLVHNRIGCCPFWYADATIHLVELLLFHLFLLFFLFHNYNTIIMLTRCVRWSRPVLLWNIVCSSVNVVHQLLVELHFLFFFLFHNDMSFKLVLKVWTVLVVWKMLFPRPLHCLVVRRSTVHFFFSSCFIAINDLFNAAKV